MGVTESPASGIASPAARPSPWIRTFHGKDDPAARVACFPHAGGAANAFTALSAALPDDVELVAVQYPGRQGRRAEPCAADIGALAAGAADALAAYADRRLFLLGHSMGGLVAFEAARLLEERDVPAAARLFASAARPPSEDWDEGDMASLTDDELVAGLRVLGGVPEPVLDDPDARREALRVLRADHLALRGYRCGDGAVLAMPVTVLLAADDPKNTAAQVRGWARHTRGRQVIERVPGGHFGVVERPADVVPVLLRYIRHDAESGRRVEATGEPAPADLLREVLLAGLGGQRPLLPTDLTALEDAARKALPEEAFGYVAGSAGTGATARANRAAFDRWRLMPRMLRGVRRADLSVTLLGRRLPAPVLLAPVAAQRVVHPDGELATVRAAATVGLPFVLSTFASSSLEDAAAEAGPSPRWFQLYLPSDRAVGESLVRRAEAHGYTALVVTVDTGNLGFRPAELDAAYSPFLRGVGLANFTGDPAFRAGLPPDAGAMATVARWARISTDPTLTWEDVAWLRGMTELPILVKGILHADDARRALDWGAAGVAVSNHGARQLDGGVAALDALPAVRAAVGDGVPVLLDSGVRTGADVLKALALGADAVLYGRPYVYGLGLDGERGVRHVLRCLLADLDLALALTGRADVADVGAAAVVPAGPVPAAPGAGRLGFRGTSIKGK